MAIKAILLRSKLDKLNARLEELRGKDADFQIREAEIETAIAEAESEEEQTAVEEAVETFSSEKDAHESAKATLEAEISELEAQLAEEEERSKKIAEPPVEKKAEERKVEINAMERTKFFGMTVQERDAFLLTTMSRNLFLACVRCVLRSVQSAVQIC